MDIIQIIDEVNRISEKAKDKIAPVEILRKFNSGRSGAGVFMVEYGDDNKVGILKVTNSSNETASYHKAYDLALKNGMHKYIAKLIADYEIKGIDGSTMYANLYDLAGDDIYKSETFLDKVLNEDELKDAILSKMTKFLFCWNKDHTKKYLSPTEIVKNELSYRYMDEKYKRAFEALGISKDIQWISLDGTDVMLPNPYYYFSNNEVWNGTKVACLTSYAHGDFQGDNVIITENKPMLIDFCDLIEDCNIFHDLRYIEAITLGDYLKIDTEKDRDLWSNVCKSLNKGITEIDIPQGRGMSLLRHLIPKLRENLKLVVSDSRNSLYNPSFYLAGVACGLINLRKYTDVNKKKAALIYAAYNLKMVLKDEAVNMFKPRLDSCMVLNWKDDQKENEIIILEPVRKNKKAKLA